MPIIDMSDYNSPKQLPKVALTKSKKLLWGFFQVINHGVPSYVLDEEALAAVKAFHEQPNEIKAKYCKQDDEKARKVVFMSNDGLYVSRSANWHDTLQVWLERADHEDIPEICRKGLVALEIHATVFADTLLELLSQGLGMEATKFKELNFSESKLVLGHFYPYCPQPDLTMGMPPHNDLGTITVLLQNQVTGFQVKHESEWVKVELVPGALIVNV